MKTTLLFLATFITIVSFFKVSATQYEWDYVSGLHNEWFKKICTQGLDTVYIVGRNGLIAKSTDRTTTWSKQYPTTQELNDIVFCNHTTGFAVGNGGVILKTTDSGANWIQQNSGIAVNITAIAATGVNNIWAVGDSGKVVYSTNAGATWQKKDFPTTANLNDISFKNNVGYIVGNAHTCLVSNDYGDNWETKNIMVNNPYNEPIEMFDLKSINQTQNHICVLVGSDFRANTINVDNRTLIHFSTPEGFVTSFAMSNDSIGYGFWGDCTTGSNGCPIFVQTINILKSQNGNVTGFGLPSVQPFDITHSDINCVNDSTAYIISGSSFFYLKKSLAVPPDGIAEAENKKLSIQTAPNRVIIQFRNEAVDKIELYTIDGLRILSQRINVNETSETIDISDFPKGIYIIRASYKDKAFANIKWIKE